ncbi:hypothetical protein [Edaphocola aurantiacus]|uniref:hypothetical protein n=1 Tax=Edaphocola aurantiacus TaxID=2601682 RepID=UPI001C979A2C|nr:hypothetical protein [Edaphocola aurantiacus]
MKHTKPLMLAGLFMMSAGMSTAQDVGKLYSPNLFDGTVNVNIPIYEQYGMGISLSYNTKGVPVRELAGPAGLHWNLNAGGGISRMIKGLPDDYRLQVDTNQQYDMDPVNGVPALAAVHMYKGRLQVAMETSTERANTKIFRDTESDEYYVSAGNMRFTFYVGENGGIFTNSFADYEISFYRDGMYRPAGDQSSTATYNFYSGVPIAIRDKKNNVIYYFGPGIKKETIVTAYFRSEASFQANPYGTDYYSGAKLPIVTNWNLDSVRYDASRTVRYTYTRFQIPNYIAQDSSWVKSFNTYQPNQAPIIAPYFNKTDFDLVSVISYPNGTQLELVYENSRLEFSPRAPYTSNPSNTYPRLNEVVFKDRTNSMRYVFDYAYFHNPSSASSSTEVSTDQGDERDRYSLKLKGIRQVSADSSLSQTLYTFGYNDLIQRRFGGGLDFYGYYNGQNIGISTHSVYPDAYKTDNAAYGQFGLLKKITSGTGGVATFTYGAHSLEDVNSVLMSTDADLAGTNANDGVRIDKIEVSDLNDTTVHLFTNFVYDGGQRFLPKGFTRDQEVYRVAGGNTADPNAPSSYYTIRNWYETFASPMALYYGSNHGYSSVTVEQKNQYGQWLSETSYEFSNFKDGTAAPKVLVTGGGTLAIEKPYTQKQRIRDWEIGLPLTVRNYDSKRLLISESFTEYQSVLDTTGAVTAGLNEAKRIVDPKPSGWLFANALEQTGQWIADFNVILDPYKPYRGQSLPKKVVTRKYASDNRYMVDSILYIYDSRYNLKSNLVNNSRGEVLRQVNIYNYDLPATLVNNDLDQLKSKGMEMLVGSEQWKMGTGTAEQQWLNAKLMSASMYTMGLNGDVPVTKGVFSLESVDPLSYATYTGQSSVPSAEPYTNVGITYTGGALPAYIAPVTKVQSFDNRGNVTETYIEGSKQYKTIFFDQTNDKKIVEIGNARKTDVAYADFDQNVQGNITFTQANIIFPGTGISNPNEPTLSVSGVKAMSGKGLYVLTATSQKDLYTTSLSTGKQYRTTFWATDNVMPSFGIENGTQFTLKHIATVGRFKQYEAFFSPSAAGQKIGFHTSANVGIEDIRIHPVEAAMQSWYYEPLFGAGSATDALGRITYFEYDKLGRPLLTRDQEGNILSKNQYSVIN